ncbi:MAG: SDR family oxidoreductase [Campylobacterales bacterium]
MQKLLVTGATGSIGEAIVKEFAKNNFYIYIHYNSSEQKAKKILQNINHQGEIISFDMKDRDEIRKKLEGVEVDVLVNNAGIIKDNLFFFMEDSEFEDVIDTNLKGLYYVTKILAKPMILKKRGSIINMTAISGIVGNQGQANYAASKGAIISLTKTLAIELGRYKIRVNAVAPGIIESEMTKDIPHLKDIKKTIPLNRIGEPSEVAKAVYFMAVDATYITAEVLNISGGMVR